MAPTERVRATKLNASSTHWPRFRRKAVDGAKPVDEGVFMDDLLRDFVIETNESLDGVDVELVRLEQDPNNAKILDNIFHFVHTIKVTESGSSVFCRAGQRTRVRFLD
jgi:hypothetical protein